METWLQLCYERDFDTGSPDGIKAYDRLSRFKHKLREEYQTEYYEIERIITTVRIRRHVNYFVNSQLSIWQRPSTSDREF